MDPSFSSEPFQFYTELPTTFSEDVDGSASFLEGTEADNEEREDEERFHHKRPLPQACNIVSVRETFLSASPFAKRSVDYWRAIIDQEACQELVADGFWLVKRLCLGFEEEELRYASIPEVIQTEEFERMSDSYVRLVMWARSFSRFQTQSGEGSSSQKTASFSTSTGFQLFFHEMLTFVLLGCFLNHYSKGTMRWKVSSFEFRTVLFDMVSEWVTGLRLTNPTLHRSWLFDYAPTAEHALLRRQYDEKRPPLSYQHANFQSSYDQLSYEDPFFRRPSSSHDRPLIYSILEKEDRERAKQQRSHSRNNSSSGNNAPLPPVTFKSSVLLGHSPLLAIHLYRRKEEASRRSISPSSSSSSSVSSTSTNKHPALSRPVSSLSIPVSLTQSSSRVLRSTPSLPPLSKAMIRHKASLKLGYKPKETRQLALSHSTSILHQMESTLRSAASLEAPPS